MQLVDAVAATRWMADTGNVRTGYDPTGWKAATWLLHSLYESDPSEVPTAQRVRWRDAAVNANAWDPSTYPSRTWLPGRSQGDGNGPLEGELDAVSHAAVVSVLTQRDGPDSPCTFHWCTLSTRDWNVHQGVAATGTLAEWAAILDQPSSWSDRLPSNVWPIDHSWMIASDTDAWGTRVSGPLSLIEALEAHDDLECVRCANR